MKVHTHESVSERAGDQASASVCTRDETRKMGRRRKKRRPQASSKEEEKVLQKFLPYQIYTDRPHGHRVEGGKKSSHFTERAASIALLCIGDQSLQ